MARQTFITLIDDITGDEGAETVAFSFQGQSYEIDLSTKNAQAFAKDMSKYIEHARKTGRATGTSRSPRGNSANRGYDLEALRDWARENGHALPARGRIRQSVIDAYKAAGGR